jgi:hypothetical protein
MECHNTDQTMHLSIRAPKNESFIEFVVKIIAHIQTNSNLQFEL